MGHLMSNFSNDDLRPALENLRRNSERRRIAERICAMDDMLVAFGATQTKEGGVEYRRVRQTLISQLDDLSGEDNSPRRLGDVIEVSQRLGDLLV